MKALPLLVLLGSFVARGADFAALFADRSAIERVYYNHRTGTKPSFEQTAPVALIERLVRDDIKKEAVLKRVYEIEITPALLDGEVQRINATTRAPEMLAEIKAALGNDPTRFAEAFAKPFLVERLLRDKFENDDTLHLPLRRECERIRGQLITARTNGANAMQLQAQLKAAHSNAVSETTWQLTPRPAATNGLSAEELEVKKRFGPDAQLLSAPSAGSADSKNYFADLPPQLQRVLEVQLRAPTDVSAVIESPKTFLLYLCTAKTETALTVACLTLFKGSYEEWIASQN